MADEYTVLTQDEQDDIVAAFVLAQEKDLFCHKINLERVTEMLKDAPDGEWKNSLKTFKTDTESRIQEVSSILKATVKPPSDRLAKAAERVRAKDARNASA